MGWFGGMWQLILESATKIHDVKRWDKQDLVEQQCYIEEVYGELQMHCIV